jgi:hypothetical protein
VVRRPERRGCRSDPPRSARAARLCTAAASSASPPSSAAGFPRCAWRASSCPCRAGPLKSRECAPRQRDSRARGATASGRGHRQVRAIPVARARALVQRERRASREVSADLEQRARGVDARAARKRRLSGHRSRHDEARPSRSRRTSSRARRGWDAARPTSPARPRTRAAAAARANLARCREDADGDRQVEAAAFLGKVGRCEVDGDASRGPSNVALWSAARTRSRASRTSSAAVPRCSCTEGRRPRSPRRAPAAHRGPRARG